MVYGDFVSLRDREEGVKPIGKLPKLVNDEYYFGIYFPGKTIGIVSSLGLWQVTSALTLLILIFFSYALIIILKQKRLSEVQNDFINNMTHEFKTPISSIKIAADVLAKEPNIATNERMKRYADIIKSQNSRLNDQVEKVLNIARIEKDSFELNIEKIDVRKTLSNIVEQESLKLKSGSITLDINEPEIYIKADMLHFTNVVTNIIDNALKYTNEEPHIKISALKDNEGLNLSIKDNGIGISKENLKKIFDKFYRVNTGNIHNVKGFGLGLFYVQNICRAHGWNISADSEENTETTIEIKIPT